MVTKNGYDAGTPAPKKDNFILHLELMPKNSADPSEMVKLEVTVARVPSSQDERYYIDAAGLDSSQWNVSSRWLECINPQSAGSSTVKEQPAMSDFARKDNAALIIPELNGAKIRKTEDGRFSVYDLIRIAGGKKSPHEVWKRLCKEYSELLTKCEFYKFPGKGRNNTPVATLENCLYILGLLPGACGKSYREKAANLVVRYIRGDADLGVEMMIRDHNKERFERAKKRLLVCETNKQTTDIALEHGVNPSHVHNDRYRGLYRMTAATMRQEAQLKKGETPLNAMSVRDLTMNSLVNQLAAEAGNPDLIFEFGDNIRQGFERTMKKSLKPIWETNQLRPSQARKLLSKGQMELPLD